MAYPEQFLEFRRWNRPYWYGAIAALLLIVVFEWQTYFVERAIGRYLVWQNEGREKIGRRWKIEEQQLLAGTRLEKLSRELRAREKQLNKIATFKQLLRSVLNKEQQSLPPAGFTRIYQTLPGFFQPLIIPADSLLSYRVANRLENVLCRSSFSGVEILFLDRQGRVEHASRLSRRQLDMLLGHGEEVIVDVERDARFVDRVFWLRHFRQVLTALDEDRQHDFLRAMPAMLELAGPATRVAISNKIVDEFVEVAIAPDNTRARIYYIPEDWIIDFISVLNEEDFLRHEAKTIL